MTQAWIYRFGDVEVETAAHRVSRGGLDLKIEPKAFAVLVTLLEQAGKALGRDELLDRVWGHRHVTPGVLNRVVAQLRKTLGDDAEHPRYIQTLHSLGYRFMGEVQQIPAVTQQPTQGPSVANRVSTAEAATPNRAMAAPRRVGWAIATCVLLAIGALVWSKWEPVRHASASIAILPFTSLSTREDDSYFAEGLAEEMRSALTSVDGLKVAASVSSTVPAGAADAKSIGDKLNVATILEASVRRQGSRVRINARLSDTSTGFTLWSQTYDRELSDVFKVQSEIAGEVVQSLLGAIPGESDALSKKLTPTKNLAAFDVYLRAVQLLRRGGPSGSEDKAIALFGQALQSDGGFARAQAGICLADTVRFENMHSAEAFDAARTACQRALDMDPTLAEVGLAFGDMYRARGDLDKALEQYRRVQQDPAVRTLAQIGMAKVYAAKGRHELAAEHFRAALELSPDDAFVHSEIGYQHYLDGHLQEAINSYREAIDLKNDSAGLWDTLGALYLEAGNNADAAAALKRSIAIEPAYSSLTNLGLIRYQAGDYPGAAKLQREAADLNPLDFMVWGNLAMALKADPTTTAEAARAYQEAATRAARYLEVQPDNARAVAALGLYRAELGDPQQARTLVDRSETLGGQPGEVALLNAETFALLGDLDNARQRLVAARHAGIAESLISTNVVFKRLALVPPKD